MTPPAQTDAELARSIAIEAGELLRSIFLHTDCSDAERGDRGDARANTLILERLNAARPGDFVLSEESIDDRTRCSARRVWIVDPLDGTREFACGRDDWAVHIGLAIDGLPSVGAVAIPATGAVFASDDPTPPQPARPARLRMAVSRSRPPEVARRVAEALDAEMVPMGSAGVKAMAVVSGEVDIYLHDGGQYEWDNCAPVAVALAAGLHASRIDGSALAYNCVDTMLPDVLICRPELAEAVLAAIAEKSWCARSDSNARPSDS